MMEGGKMSYMKVLIIFLLLIGIVWNASVETPRPLGIVLGKTSDREAERIVKEKARKYAFVDIAVAMILEYSGARYVYLFSGLPYIHEEPSEPHVIVIPDARTLVATDIPPLRYPSHIQIFTYKGKVVKVVYVVTDSKLAEKMKESVIKKYGLKKIDNEELEEFKETGKFKKDLDPLERFLASKFIEYEDIYATHIGNVIVIVGSADGDRSYIEYIHMPLLEELREKAIELYKTKNRTDLDELI